MSTNVFKLRADTSAAQKSIDSLASSFYKNEQAVKNVDKSLKNFNTTLSGSISSFKSLSQSFSVGSFDGLAGSIGSLIGNTQNLGSSLSSVATGLMGMVNPTTLAIGGIVGLGAVVTSAISSFNDFEVKLDALQSLTGLDDFGMKDVSNSAIELSKSFRSSAGEIIESMQLIGSQAPELLKSSSALEEVTRNANVLAEASGISVQDASKGITTIMNQMGVSANETSNIINVLASASQQGSADVAYLQQAIEKSGTAFKSANVDYTSLVATIETIAPKFGSADVAGSQLASTMLKLSTKAKDEFKPSVVGLNQALDNLAKAQLTDAELVKLVGESNVTMIKSLIEGRDVIQGYEKSLKGTNTAFEQMEINQGNVQAQSELLKNKWEALLLTIGHSDFVQGLIKSFMLLIEHVGDFINYISDSIKEFTGFNSSIDILGLLEGALKALGVVMKVQMEFIKITIASVMKIIGELVDIAKSSWNKLKSIFNIPILEPFKNLIKSTYQAFMGMIDGIISAWNKFKKWLGLQPVEVDIKTNNTLDIKTNTKDIPVNVDVTDSSIEKVNKKISNKLGKTTGKVKVEFEVGSIADLQNKLKGINEQLTNKRLDESIVKGLISEKSLIEEQIKQLQIRNGLLQVKEDAPDGSLAKVQNQISEVQTKLKFSIEGSDEFNRYKDELKTLKDKEQKIQLSIDGSAIEGSLAHIRSLISDKKVQLDLEVVGSERFKELAKEIGELTKEEKKISIQIENAQLSDTELLIKANNEAIAETKRQMESTAESVSVLGSMFGNLGKVVGGSAGEVLDLFSQVGNGISQLIPQIATYITAQKGAAIASATASGAALPPPFNLINILSTVASIASVFASKIPKFKDGGIVKGYGSRINDGVLTRLNPGEMVLNDSQQNRLWRFISQNQLQASYAPQGEVQFRISGDSLHGVLQNYNKITGRVR